MTRLFIVDDHPVVRSGIRAALAPEPGLLVVGEASHGQDLLDQLPTTPADVVLLDIAMPVLGGLATAQRLRAEFPAVKILALSILSHERHVEQMLSAGALGYALKTDEMAEIVVGIRTVAASKPYLCSDLSLLMLHKVLTREQEPAPLPEPNYYNFSPREVEILQLLANGQTTVEIAARLLTSRRTIESHRQNMLDKSQAKNVAMLIRLAMAQGLLR